MGISGEINKIENYINEFKTFVDGICVFKLINVHSLANMLNKSTRQTELYLIERNILPYRYIGTTKFIGLKSMEKLLKSRVAIVGCGGVGGFVCELCARLGVGEILLFDGDVFEESNLNRQIGCLEKNIGKYKAEILAERIKEINSGINVINKNIYLREDLLKNELAGCDVVIDAVDNVQDRLNISKVCKELKIPFIHGSIGNSSIHVGVSKPNNNFLEDIYSSSNSNNKLMGSPATTVMMCAALQVCELVKIICEIGDSLRGNLLHFNWLSNDFFTIDFTNN